MNKSILFVIAGITLLTSACGPSREKTVKQIQHLEQRLFSPEADSFDKSKADSLLMFYESFIKENPGDSLRPAYLFKAANLTMNMNAGEKAIVFFDQYRQEYPSGPKVQICLFFKAFIYENQIRDLEKAREFYNQFIKLYPENEFSDDARMALQNLGKSPEEMVREFEARQKADSLAAALTAKEKPKKK